MNEYWVVIEKKTGRVIAHCGDINDALMLVSFDVNNRSYSRQRYLMDQVIDISSTSQKQLPTTDIVVNMDGGVGGSWEVREPIGNGAGQLPQIKLPEGQQEPVIV